VSEKQLLQLHGLLPPAVLTQEDEVKIAVLNVERCPTDLDKYIYLMDLLARNERLFYRVIMDNIEMMLPIIYTPTVGLACQNFGLLFRHPQYVILSILDHLDNVAIIAHSIATRGCPWRWHHYLFSL